MLASGISWRDKEKTMPKSLSRETAAMLMSTSVVVGSTALAAATAATNPVLGGVLGGALTLLAPVLQSLGIIGGSIISSKLDRAIAKIRPEKEVLFNHDLVVAVGDTIAQLLIKASKDDRFYRDRTILIKMAEKAREVWLETAQHKKEQYAELRGENMPNFLAQLAESVLSDTKRSRKEGSQFSPVLSAELWKQILDLISEKASESLVLRYKTRKILADEFSVMFSQTLYEILKFDKESPHGGRAYAGVELLMMGEILSNTRCLLETIAEDKEQVAQVLTQSAQQVTDLSDHLKQIENHLVTHILSLWQSLDESSRSHHAQYIEGLSKLDGRVQVLSNQVSEMHAEVQGQTPLLNEIRTAVLRIEERGIGLSQPKESSETIKFPEPIQTLFNQGWEHRHAGRHSDAASCFRNALDVAIREKHNVAIAEAQYSIAFILVDRNERLDEAKNLLQDSLITFREAKLEKDTAAVLMQLGIVALNELDFDQAEAYTSQALDIANRINNRIGQANYLKLLGWIKDGRGMNDQAIDLFRQALSLFMEAYQQADAKRQKEYMMGVAGCYAHLAMVYRRKGDPVATEANLIAALDWYRQSDFRPDLAKTLVLLAKLKFQEAEYKVGEDYLEEATSIYGEIGDHLWKARCLELRAQLLFTLGRRDDAEKLFEAAMRTIEKCNDSEEKIHYLNTLGFLHIEEHRLDIAEKTFEKARGLTRSGEFHEEHIRSAEGLAEIAQLRNDVLTQKAILLNAATTLRKHLPSVLVESRRAYLAGKLGWLYEKSGDHQEALSWYQHARKAFEALRNSHGVANCLGSIARLKGALGYRREELETYTELLNLVDGTHYYEIIAGTALNLGAIHTEMGDLDEAKRLLDRAMHLSTKHSLGLDHALRSLYHSLTQKQALIKPAQLSFEELVDELYDLINWFPEASKELFRLWVFGRINVLLGSIKHLTGVRMVVYENGNEQFSKLSKMLRPYFDLCLQVVDDEYPSGCRDVVPFPPERPMFFNCGVLAKGPNDKLVFVDIDYPDKPTYAEKYILTCDRAQSPSTGHVGTVLVGSPRGLPNQAYDLLLPKTANQVKSEGIFFLPYERYREMNKIVSDLHLCAELGAFPVYIGKLPKAAEVDIVASVTASLPLEGSAQTQLSSTVKQALARLGLSSFDNVKSRMEDFVQTINQANARQGNAHGLLLQFHALSFPSGVEKKLQTALVIIKGPVAKNT
jgi:tetratricopeptide (TPR) repeat protein